MKKPYRGLNLSRIKLIIDSDSTVVDEKNRRVIHTIDWHVKGPYLMHDLFYIITSDLFSGGKISGRAKGIAICKSDDVFDPVAGTRMARAIAENNAYHNASEILRKRMLNLYSLVSKIDEQVVDFRLKTGEIITHNKEYHDSIVASLTPQSGSSEKAA